MNLTKFLTTVTSFSKILTAVIFVILPFAGFYLGLKYEAQFTKYLEDRTSLDRYSLKPTKTQDASTANWKTYTSISLGFSFKYPSDYFKFQQDYSDIGVYLAPSSGEGGNGPKFLKPEDVWINAVTSSGANLKSLDEYLTLPGQQIFPVNSQRTQAIIGQVYGYVIEYSSPISAGNVTEYKKVGIVLKNETIYTISLSAWRQEVLQANQKMFDQILSTFKFTK